MDAPWFIAIGASGSDGLIDIKQLLERLPADLNAVILVVLHRAWDRVSHLRAALEPSSPFPILIARDGERLARGTVYIGEPSDHLRLATASLGEIFEDPAGLYRNRTVDLLFSSVATYSDGRCIGVVLSGSLDDGSRGLADIHRAGGWTMVISRPPGLLGMPENAISYDGPVTEIGDATAIASAIVRAVTNRR
jgi:two-component system chemotaxis response regulator CheB